ncbi:MAG: hypothetical protein METHP_02050 [Methanoregula sp. SKADARSKE-2]|nr:MAG: hypothetical protein METHP_02050 [Methanoregula sp. SKADARSKE-2]
MVKMLIELSDEVDKIVEVYKVVKGMNSKQDAIKEMIRYFAVKIRPKNIEEKTYFK